MFTLRNYVQIALIINIGGCFGPTEGVDGAGEPVESPTAPDGDECTFQDSDGDGYDDAGFDGGYRAAQTAFEDRLGELEGAVFGGDSIPGGDDDLTEAVTSLEESVNGADGVLDRLDSLDGSVSANTSNVAALGAIVYGPDGAVGGNDDLAALLESVTTTDVDNDGNLDVAVDYPEYLQVGYHAQLIDSNAQGYGIDLWAKVNTGVDSYWWRSCDEECGNAASGTGAGVCIAAFAVGPGGDPISCSVSGVANVQCLCAASSNSL